MPNFESPLVSSKTQANTDKRFLKALNGQKVDRPPFWFMRQAGRYLPEYRALRKEAGHFLTLCYTPDMAVEVTLQPIRRFDMDAAILFSDILVIPDALGQHVDFKTGEGPVLEALRHEQDLKKLSLGGLHEHLEPVYTAVERLSRELPPHTALIGFAGAPWTVATYMIGGKGSPDQAAAKTWAYGNPELFQKLIDLLVEATIQYLTRQIRAGAETVQIFDSWAGSLPPSQFERWCVDPVRRIIQGVSSNCPGVPVIAFPRGAGPSCLGYAEKTGATAVGIDTALPCEWVAEHIQPSVCVQGNLDPRILVAGGDLMRKETQHILSRLSKGPYIFNLGHGIVPETPVEHVAELCEIIRNFKPT